MNNHLIWGTPQNLDFDKLYCHNFYWYSDSIHDIQQINLN